MSTQHHDILCRYRITRGTQPCNKGCTPAPAVTSDSLRRDLALMTGRYHEVCAQRDALQRRIKEQEQRWKMRAA